MQWWGWLVLGVLVLLVLVLLFILLRRSPPGLTKDELKRLEDVSSKDLKFKLLIEQEENTQIKLLMKQQQERLQSLGEWYNAYQDGIADTHKKGFEKFLGDADAAGAEFDRLFGTNKE